MPDAEPPRTALLRKRRRIGATRVAIRRRTGSSDSALRWNGSCNPETGVRRTEIHGVGDGRVNYERVNHSRDRVGPDTAVARAAEPVRGLQHDMEQVVSVVDELTAEGIPTHALHLFVVDPTGRPVRRPTVRKGPGVARGGAIGGIVGGAFGLVVVALALLGSDGAPGPGVLGASDFLVVAAVILASAVLCVPVGALIAWARQRSRRSVSTSSLDGAPVMVVVQAEERTEAARRILGEAGAEHPSA